jgi:hypothetical protein
MLIVVVCLCLLEELPHGILKILVAIYGDWFANKFYNNVGDLIDFVTLFYSSVNFVGNLRLLSGHLVGEMGIIALPVYCVMSREFRRTFLELYCVSHVSRGVRMSVSGTRRTIRRVSRHPVPKASVATAAAQPLSSIASPSDQDDL